MCTWYDNLTIAHSENLLFNPVDFPNSNLIRSASFSHTRGTPKKTDGLTCCNHNSELMATSCSAALTLRVSMRLPFKASGLANQTEPPQNIEKKIS
jgi:hypothetical protein